MTVNLPLVKNSPQNSVINVNPLHASNSQSNAQTPSFGFNPEKLITIKNEKIKNFFKKAGNLSTPMNRFIIGAVAISSQPWIDLYNKDTDEETRKTSCLRTAAKIIVGTTTGIIARVLCINAMAHFSRTTEEIAKLKAKGKNISKLATALVPDCVTAEKYASAGRLLGKHRKALGSFIAIAVMMLTDPPLTKFLTNYFNDKRKQAEQANAKEKGASNV